MKIQGGKKAKNIACASKVPLICNKFNLKKNKWAKKESIRHFFQAEEPRIKKYFSSIELSEDEKRRSEQLKDAFKKCNLFDPNDISIIQSIIPEYSNEILGINNVACWPTLCNKVTPIETIGNSILKGLNREDLEFYQEYGVIGPYTLEGSIKKKIEFIHDRILKNSSNSLKLSAAHIESKSILLLGINPGIISNISSILGEDVVLVDSSIHLVPNAKKCRNKSFISHSDVNVIGGMLPLSFYQEKESGFVTVWISISGTNEYNSPLHFFPTTHKFSIIPAIDRLRLIKKNPKFLEYYCRLLSLSGNKHYSCISAMNFDSILEHLKNIDQCDNIMRTEIYTEPGEYIIFNGHVLHGSIANNTSNPRLAINFRYRAAKEKVHNGGYFDFTRKKLEKFYTSNELKLLGIAPFNHKIPIIQISGKECNDNYYPLSIEKLLNVMENKKYL